MTKSVILFLVFFSVSTLADSIDRRVRVATDLFEDRMESERPVPNYILDASQCVAALKVVKAGLIWGGQGSTGLVSCRTGEGWSTPSFFSVSGVNFGFQIGVQFMESVLTFMTDHSRDILERATFKVGTDLSFAAGPVGGGGGTGVIPDAHILTYSRSKGLYAGATIEGFVLSHIERDNHEIYNQKAPGDILANPNAEEYSRTLPFVQVLTEYAP